ncbi:ranBP2-type zinc finger protein At1g67325-like isoform X2 [Zingiber officinale]|nr:ranBP2-type zinc finger protein At1g67325-like isoform X2 [Zingiber officinale]XP_042448534.1 ranBP2-type zinc finger protein At1g67325-like isoform X2 [Zingiber officinale]
MNRKPGDWTCRSCQHLNFSRRDSCQRCSDPRPTGGDRSSDFFSFGSGGGGRGGSSFGFIGSDVRPGDWYCSCGAHNFASRSSCFKCASLKEDSAVGSGGSFDGDTPRSRGYSFGGGGGRAGWKSGDWICNRSGCNEHNFASRMECFRCNAPRDSGTEV